jgi:hypothetical protein
MNEKKRDHLRAQKKIMRHYWELKETPTGGITRKND